jgi:hypothetical protein
MEIEYNTLIDLLVLATGDVLYVGELDEVVIKHIDVDAAIRECDDCILYNSNCYIPGFKDTTAPCQNLEGEFTNIFKKYNKLRK